MQSLVRVLVVERIVTVYASIGIWWLPQIGVPKTPRVPVRWSIGGQYVTPTTGASLWCQQQVVLQYGASPSFTILLPYISIVYCTDAIDVQN